MANEEIKLCCAGCSGIILLLILIIGWDSIDVTQWGLKCNKITKRCEDESNI
jgi:hypothetical protein